MIVWELHGEGELEMEGLVEQLSAFQLSMAIHGFLVRGSISAGEPLKRHAAAICARGRGYRSYRTLNAWFHATTSRTVQEKYLWLTRYHNDFCADLTDGPRYMIFTHGEEARFQDLLDRGGWVPVEEELDDDVPV